uniref:BTB (POZ) domain containing 6b n=1 Tax=Fundulus heteroclitus TaxID=8078 RepID=A0A3Q2T8F8_FUNHE
MAAELFSTSLPHGEEEEEEEEEETKRSFIQLSEAKESADRHDDRIAAPSNNNGEEEEEEEEEEDGEERPGWQAHPTLRERNALMFNNEHMADIHFIVGPPGETQTVPAHKYVLAVGSSVFGAMFYGDLAEGQAQIHIPDVEPALSGSNISSSGWAGLAVTPRNQRAALGKALYLLRIPSMSLQEFADGPAQSDVLTLTETHNIFLWYTATNKPQLDFPVGKRVGLAPQRCHRFQASAYRSNQWRYRGRCDSIQFAVDRRIFMAGLGLYGSSGGKAEYSVRIELKRQGTLLAHNLTKFLSDGSSSTFAVWFEHPVQVEQDTFYTVSAVLDGNELSYFGQEGMTEVQSGKVTFQFQCSSDSTNGTGVQGGQIPELIFYC